LANATSSRLVFAGENLYRIHVILFSQELMNAVSATSNYANAKAITMIFRMGIGSSPFHQIPFIFNFAKHERKLRLVN
jgi:hypothetical protein